MTSPSLSLSVNDMTFNIFNVNEASRGCPNCNQDIKIRHLLEYFIVSFMFRLGMHYFKMCVTLCEALLSALHGRKLERPQKQGVSGLPAFLHTCVSSKAKPAPRNQDSSSPR